MVSKTPVITQGLVECAEVLMVGLGLSVWFVCSFFVAVCLG